MQILNQTSLCSATYVRWRRGTARIHPRTPLLQQSIDISCLPGPQQQTHCRRLAAVDPCWDGQTDTLGSANNTVGVTVND